MISHSTYCKSALKSADTDALRDSYLLTELFEVGQLQLVYTDLDRAIVG